MSIDPTNGGAVCLGDACPWCGDSPSASVRRVLSVETPREIVSTNAHRVNRGASMHEYRRYRQGWARDLAALVPNTAKQATRKRRVVVTRFYGKGCRRFDARNFDSKALIDALVSASVLVDDSPRWAVVHHVQAKAERHPSTRIEVYEFEDTEHRPEPGRKEQ